MPISVPDPSWFLDDGVTVHAPGGAGLRPEYGLVDGDPLVFAHGAGATAWRGLVAFDVQALATIGGDETYLLEVQGSNTADFSGAVQTLSSLSVGAVGQFLVPLYSLYNETLYAYFRLKLTVGGVAPSIRVLSFVQPLAAIEGMTLPQQIAVLGMSLANFNAGVTNFREWMAGAVGGGPAGDGRYPLSDGAGNTVNVLCPAAIAAAAGGAPLSVGLFSALGAINVPLGVDVIQTSGHGLKGLGGARYVSTATTTATAYRAKSLNNRWFELAEPELRPEHFGARGDGINDDMAAFQLASNYLQDKGGGRLRLTAPRYYLEKYTAGQVGGRILDVTGIAGATVSRLWAVPGNVDVVGSWSALLIKGGSSSPFGFNSGVNLLVYSGQGEVTTTVTAVNQAAHAVTVSSVAALQPDQRVRLLRQGGNTAGVPNTPSQEDAPQQFLTIESIVGLVVTFKEAFVHRFETVQDLKVSGFSDHRDFSGNTWFDGVTFESAGSGPYVLFSRLLGGGFRRVRFSPGIGFSFGMSQRMRIEDLASSCAAAGSAGSIESCNDFEIGSVVVEGNGSNSGGGGLLINDHSFGRIGSYTARNFTRTGLALLYGTRVVIDRLNLINCGTAADPVTDYTGALVAGIPPLGSYATLPIARAAAYLMRNSGGGDLHVRKLTITGPARTPVRIHDCRVVIDDADIEGVDTKALITIGASREQRADATWYPKGGQSSLKAGYIRGRTASGTPRAIDANGGYAGLYAGFTTTLAAAVVSGDTTMTVADPDRIFVGNPVFIADEGGTNPLAASPVVLSRAGGVLTLDRAVNFAAPIGQGVWTLNPQQFITQNIAIDRFDINGVTVATYDGEAANFPALDGSNTYVLTTDVPSDGDWVLEVAASKADAAAVIGEYRVARLAAGAVSMIAQAFKSSSGAAIDISAASMAGATASITFGSNAGGTIWVRWAWRRPRRLGRLT